MTGGQTVCYSDFNLIAADGAPQPQQKSAEGVKGKQVRDLHDLVTVNGEYAARLNCSHWFLPGRRRHTKSRESGNLPSVRVQDSMSFGQLFMGLLPGKLVNAQNDI